MYFHLHFQNESKDYSTCSMSPGFGGKLHFYCSFGILWIKLTLMSSHYFILENFPQSPVFDHMKVVSFRIFEFLFLQSLMD